MPIIGAVWQPRLWTFFINRTTVQTFDNGAPGRLRDTEIANRMDFYANLQLTGTGASTPTCMRCSFSPTPTSALNNLDMIYVDDNARNGDAFYIGASAIQRIKALGGISTAFRINNSIALDEEIGGNVIGDGSLLTAEFSTIVPGSDDIAYFNPFISIGNFTQDGSEKILGGPLASPGILFASPNLILEIAGRYDYDGQGFDQLGRGFQLQQAIGQHFQAQLEGYYVFNGERDDGVGGGRAELLIVY